MTYTCLQAEVEAAREREAAADRRVEAAEKARQAAEEAKQVAEKERRQAELAAATAASVAEAERQQRAEAQGMRWDRWCGCVSIWTACMYVCCKSICPTRSVSGAYFYCC